MKLTPGNLFRIFILLLIHPYYLSCSTSYPASGDLIRSRYRTFFKLREQGNIGGIVLAHLVQQSRALASPVYTSRRGETLLCDEASRGSSPALHSRVVILRLIVVPSRLERLRFIVVPSH